MADNLFHTWGSDAERDKAIDSIDLSGYEGAVAHGG